MSLFGKKPKTLGEAVRRVKSSEQKFDPAILEFLDAFYGHPGSREAALVPRHSDYDSLDVSG